MPVVAYYGAAAVFAAAITALGFSFTDTTKANAAITQMMADASVATSSILKYLVFSDAAGTSYKILGYLINGAPTVAQEVIAWVQSWLASNGAYESGGVKLNALPLGEQISFNSSTVIATPAQLYKEVTGKTSLVITSKSSSAGWISVGDDALTNEVFTNNYPCIIYSPDIAEADAIFIWILPTSSKSISFTYNQEEVDSELSVKALPVGNGYCVQIYSTGVFAYKLQSLYTTRNESLLSSWSFNVAGQLVYTNTSTYTTVIESIGILNSDTSLTKDTTFPTEAGTTTSVDAIDTWLANQVTATVEGIESVAGTVEGVISQVLTLPLAISEALDVATAIDYAGAITQAVAQTGAFESTAAEAEATIDPSPSIALPNGPTSVSDTDFFSLWNPSKTELNELASFLWSADFVDVIAKALQNPMDVIIGLTMIPVEPPQGSDEVLRLGLVSSGVTMTRLSTQFSEFSCGSIEIPLKRNSYLDYDPYTHVEMFIPFVGIVPLKTNEVMGSTLTLQYNIDFLSGACMAMVQVERSDVSGILYTFGGNMSAPVPITSNDYSRIYQAGINALIGVGTAFATGGASLAGQVAESTAANSVSNFLGGSISANVQRSGATCGNAGLLGSFTPYVIITRAIPSVPTNYSAFYGYQLFDNILLSNLSGFTKVYDVHVAIPSATQSERNEIERLLKEGVIL